MFYGEEPFSARVTSAQCILRVIILRSSGAGLEELL
jgi:hypothetical protein